MPHCTPWLRYCLLIRNLHQSKLKKIQLQTYSKIRQNMQSVWRHGFRLKKRDDYFWVNFDHFWIEQYFCRKLGQYWKLTQAYKRTTIGKFSLPKFVKRSAQACMDDDFQECNLKALLDDEEVWSMILDLLYSTMIFAYSNSLLPKLRVHLRWLHQDRRWLAWSCTWLEFSTWALYSYEICAGCWWLSRLYEIVTNFVRSLFVVRYI